MFMLYDVMIAGGGPAGAVLGFLLQSQGLSCLILEKRDEIDEKVCGGFVTSRCRELLLSCGIQMEKFVSRTHRIAGTVETCLGAEMYRSYTNGRYGMGVFRKTLDGFLLAQAQQAGVKVCYGSPLYQYHMRDGMYEANGFLGRKLVWAVGAQNVFKITCIARDQAQVKMRSQSCGISEMVRLDGGRLNPDLVYFWYTGSCVDYFWAIPLPDGVWNIGYWTQSERQHLWTNFISGRRLHIEESCQCVQTVLKPRAAILGNESLAECLPADAGLCCGDFAGTNSILTGEGLTQAVASACNIAEEILREVKTIPHESEKGERLTADDCSRARTGSNFQFSYDR